VRDHIMGDTRQKIEDLGVTLRAGVPRLTGQDELLDSQVLKEDAYNIGERGKICRDRKINPSDAQWHRESCVADDEPICMPHCSDDLRNRCAQEATLLHLLLPFFYVSTADQRIDVACGKPVSLVRHPDRHDRRPSARATYGCRTVPLGSADVPDIRSIRWLSDVCHNVL